LSQGWYDERFLRRHGLFSGHQGFLKEFWIQMKQSLAIAVLMASGVALAAAAQTPAEPAGAAPATTTTAAPAGPPKIAVVAFQVAVGQTNEFQRNFADLQKKYDPKRQQLKTLNDDIDNLTKQLQAQGDKLSDAERATRQADRRQEEATPARRRRRVQRLSERNAGDVPGLSLEGL